MFRITNFAFNALVNYNQNVKKLNASLEKLSTGFRINKAADDASGLQIADSLKNQADSLSQAIKNANEAIGLLQIADKAMDEQLKIVNTIKVKATQAAQDGQTTETRKAIQEDIVRLMKELDNIAFTTSYNSKKLLAGNFINQKFQIGAYSNETVNISIGATNSNKIGHTRFEMYNFTINSATVYDEVKLKFLKVDGLHDVEIESIPKEDFLTKGVGYLAEIINKNSEKLGVRAWWDTTIYGASPINSGIIVSLAINGIKIGNIEVKENDGNGALIAAINKVKDQTGVEAFLNEDGAIGLRSIDGRHFKIEGENVRDILGFTVSYATGAVIHSKIESADRLHLIRLDGRDIVVSITGYLNPSNKDLVKEATLNLQDTKKQLSDEAIIAIGNFKYRGDAETANYSQVVVSLNKSLGVTTIKGSMAVMNLADSALKMLDKIRADIGSVHNQLISTINNISVTQVNIKAAESQIRDLDFAKELAEFNKTQLLVQSGSFALSQTIKTMEVIMKLLK